MRLFHILSFLLLTIPILAQNTGIVFTENKSQYPQNVRFKADISGGSVFLEDACLTYVFKEKKTHDFKTLHSNHNLTSHQIDLLNTIHAYKVHFVDFNSACKITTENPIDGYENVFVGNDPKKWSNHIKSYFRVTYNNLWNGIDLVMYQKGTILKYDFVVHPGANPNQIKLKYEGVESIKITENDIRLKTSINEVIERKPISYQFSEDKKDTIQSFYVLDDEDKTTSFRIYRYDKHKTLFIDPELIFSTYTGSKADNWGFTSTFDNDGNVYSGGIVSVSALQYPVNLGSYQQKGGGLWDIAIIKYDPTGTKRLYATYLGGSSSEMPHSMVVNSKNELVVFGITGSADFPLKNGYDKTFNGGMTIDYDNIQFDNGTDIYIAKLSPDGSNLLASTFIGGSNNDGLNYDNDISPSELETGNDSLYFNYGDGARGEITVDKYDNVYVGSCSFSSDFPTKYGFQTALNGREEGIVFKMNSNLSNLVWSSFMGGTSDDAVYSIDVDVDNNVYITGGTNSNNLTTTIGTLNQNYIGGSADAFVSKIASSGLKILASTYWGSSDYDQSYFVRVDKQKHVYLYGQTKATGKTLIKDALYNQPNSGQFISKFSNTLDTVIWSTTFGTGVNQPNISPTAMSVDVCNRVYIAGVGREWPIEISPAEYIPALGLYKYGYDWSFINGTKNMQLSADAYQKITDGKDFYFMVIDDKASSLDYATFFGEQYDGGAYYYDPILDHYSKTGCPASGRDHVDGGTSRFDKVGNIYQSVCASCGGCNAFPTYPKPGAWSNNNNAGNCNNATLVFRIHRDQMQANFTPQISPCNPYLVTFKNTSTIIDTLKVTYLWDFGDKTPKSTLRNPSHIYSKKGEYFVKLIIKDNSSCNFVDSVTYPIEIIDTSGTIALNTLNICNGDSIALGKVFPTDGVVSFKWTPSTSLSNDTVPNPYAHPNKTITYTVVVKLNGCMQTYTQTVTVYNSAFSMKIKQISGGTNNKVCLGTPVKLKLQIGEPATSITWAYDRKFEHQITPTADDSTVTLNITNDTMIYARAIGKYCGNLAIDSINLVIVKPSFIPCNDTTICKNSTIKLTAKNTNPSVSLIYNWVPKSIVVSGQMTNTVFVKPETSTIVNVTGTSAEGCFMTKSIIVKVDEMNIDSARFSDISCHNKNDATIEIVTKGVPTNTYTWNDGNKTNKRTNLGEGEYSVTIVNSNGCHAVYPFVVINPDSIKNTANVSDETCKGACNGAIFTTTIGGTKPYTYNWSTNDTSSYITKKCPNFYSVIITDGHGCKTTIGGTIGLTIKLPKLDAYAEKTKIYRSQSTKLIAIKNAPDTISYKWIPNDGLETPNQAVTIATPDTTTLFFVYAIDQYGCQSIDTVTIFVRDFKCDAPYVYVPNAFSPNDDKVNDILFVESKVVDTLYFAIYTRWGEKVFETRDITNGWDGTYKGEKLSPAVFVYYIDAVCIDKQRLQKKGNISLLR